MTPRFGSGTRQLRGTGLCGSISVGIESAGGPTTGVGLAGVATAAPSGTGTPRAPAGAGQSRAATVNGKDASPEFVILRVRVTLPPDGSVTSSAPGLSWI